MAKKFDYDVDDGVIQKKRKLKILAVNSVIVAGVLTLVVFAMSIVKEGLIAAAAESKVSDVREKVVDESTHEINFDVAKKLGCNAKS